MGARISLTDRDWRGSVAAGVGSIDSTRRHSIKRSFERRPRRDRGGLQVQRRGEGVPEHGPGLGRGRSAPRTYALEIERQEDHDGTNFPRELWQDMAEAGFFGIGIDEELGGQGGDCTIQSIFMEEISRSLAGIAWIWGVNQFNTKSIQRFASEDLKQELIPQLVEGKVKTAIAVTEPGAGTDLLGGMITTAVPRRRRLPDQRRQDLVDDGPRLATTCSCSPRPTRTPRRRHAARRSSSSTRSRTASSRGRSRSSACAASARARCSSTTPTCPPRT